MKKVSLILAILICCGLNGCTLKSDSKDGERISKAIEKSDNIEIDINTDINNIEENLKSIASNIRNYGSEGEAEASEYIKSKLEEYGYTVQFEEFEVYEQIRRPGNIRTNEEYFNNNPYNADKTGTGRNIIAKQKSFDKNKKTIYLTAHYDTTKDTSGVMDNASGCSTILEVAKVLKDYNNEFNIGIIFFSAEEYGKVGSKDFVSKLSDNEKENILGCINVDMVGEKEAGELIVQSVNGRPNILSLMFNSTLDNGMKLIRGGGSDDASFYMGEIPVITITDENSNPKLAAEENQFDHIDINVIKKVCDTIIEFLTNINLSDYEKVLKETIIAKNTDNEIMPIDGFKLVDKRDRFIGNGYSVQREYYYENEEYSYVIREKDRKFVDYESLDDLIILSKENEWWYKVVDEPNNDKNKLIFNISGYYGEIEGNISLEQGMKALKNYYKYRVDWE